MPATDYIGKIGKSPLGTLADKAAAEIVAAKGSRAVCVDPSGVVTVELYDDAVPEDRIGNYTGEAGRLALGLLILGDLKEMMAERGVQAAQRRYVVREGARRAA